MFTFNLCDSCVKTINFSKGKSRFEYIFIYIILTSLCFFSDSKCIEKFLWDKIIIIFTEIIPILVYFQLTRIKQIVLLYKSLIKFL